MNTKIFLDSGAFSAFTKKKVIDIYEYIRFIKEHIDHLEVYANLDVIGDAKNTLKNQRIMEQEGLSPMPVYHYGEDKKYLRIYLEDYDYIGIGGMVPISSPVLTKWLDDLFANHITDKDGIPVAKFHGFGLTDVNVIARYPWHSVDSSTWVMASRMGTIAFPMYKNGWRYDMQPMKVAISNKTSHSTGISTSFVNFTVLQKKLLLFYLDEIGFKLGKSEFRYEEKDYVLESDEKIAMKYDSEVLIEKIIEEGVTNSFKIRDAVNIIYFQNLEKYLSTLPYQFKPQYQIKNLFT